MNCLEFRRAVGAEPSVQTPALLAHAARCKLCRRYRAQVQRIDWLIHRALNVEFREPSEPRRIRGQRLPRCAAACSAIAATLLGRYLWFAGPRGSLAEQLVAHVESEPHALLRVGAVDAAQLDDVLAPSGVRLDRDVGTVSFAMMCWFGGRYVPHLVVQGEYGPVTVLVLEEDSAVTRRESFNEGGHRGVVLPAPRGALAVLGRGAQAEQVAERFLHAVEYSL